MAEPRVKHRTDLELLTLPNPTLNTHDPEQKKWTYNADWRPIENVAEWSDFSYQNLLHRYGTDLKHDISPFEPASVCEEAGWGEIFEEQCLHDLVMTSIILPVSYTLPNGLFMSSSTKMKEDDINPDFAAGDYKKRSANGRYHGLFFGDVKYKWQHEDAINLIQGCKHGYEDVEGKDIVRPFEQTQQYGIIQKSRYAAIIHERGLLAIRFRLSNPPEPKSARPQRNATKGKSHQRVISDTTVSEVTSNFSDLSFDKDTVLKKGVDIAELQISVIPWEGRDDGLTIKLALCFLALAANENSDLREEYTSLHPRPIVPIEGSPSEIGTSKEGSTTRKTKNKVKLQLSSDRKSYTCTEEGETWQVEDWEERGKYVLHLELMLQAQKPE
ncbi:hypothetical protein BDV25DRAFT_143277 [Aspergillus avenaceus]|uniref:Uncharacterized protein n=1 Tax=Aspergillus avenaceus TaxID=36643 RepID=A0A5N6TKK0_ASPAV|nr:hypothetical protein BDV25DRAFT_143277 [Aspergillus avenaceus]